MLPVEQMYEDMQPVLKAGRPEDVLRSLRNTVRSFPDLARAHNDLGMLYYQTGDRQKALCHFERATAIAPCNPVFLKSLADCYHVEMGRVEDAVRLYSKIVELQPNEVAILSTTANLLVSLKRFDEAATHYRNVLNIEPWNTETIDALQQLQRIRIGANIPPKERPVGTQGFMNHGNAAAAWLQTGKTGEGLHHPLSAQAHHDLGVLACQVGEKDKALHHYEEAVRLQPDNHAFQKDLGDFYWVEQGRAEDALRIYVRILETRPKDIATLMSLAQVCGALSRGEDARAFYMRVLEIAPWNTDAKKGMEELQRGSPCISPTPAQSPQDLYEEATRLISAGDTAAGSDRLLHLEALYPEFALAHNDLGVLAYQSGKKQEALERYQKATQLEPSNMIFQKNLADCYWVGFSRHEDALKIYVDLLSAFPKDLETLLATGKLCQALRRPDDARVFFERVLEVEPWNAAANEELEQLEASVNAA
jgi:tetratricopeptide (TPR) repeat protein